MTPRYATVPEHWKHPNGPYRQAPAEHGGEWWLVNPFTSSMPWLTQSQPREPEVLPEGFVEIFGPRPQGAQFRETSNPSLYHRLALVEWEQNLRQFVRSGLPEWASTGDVEAASAVCEAWGMGRPRFFEGRYGWTAAFPASQAPDFNAPARTAIENTHLVVAQYQLTLIERGLTPERRHPFTPPHTWPGEVGEA